MTRRSARTLSTVIAIVACVTVWISEHAEPQVADLVAQGRQALDADKVDEAIAILEKAVAADPSSASALAWLGSAQVRKARTAGLFNAAGWVKKGFTTLDEAVERFPDTFVVYLVRGITATNVPDFFKKAPVAVKDLTTVIATRETNPGSVPESVMPSVYLNLGRAHKKMGRVAEARGAWERGRQLYPAAPETEAIERELRGR